MDLSKVGKTLVVAIVFSLITCLGSSAVFAEEADAQETATTTEKATQATTATVTTTERHTENTADKTESVKTETTQKSETTSSETTTASKTKDDKKKTKVKNIKQTEKVVDITKEKETPDNNGTSSNKVIPKIYNDHSLEMKNKKETINGYIYFNQGDAAWNDNGYRIKKAGCGPTSMAVVISSLTGKWVTPVDTTVWAYKHGYYSSAGSLHSLIPALSKEYGLNCKGVGTNIDKIRTALKNDNPVVCLMGPGYFTSGGHFMVLVDIDKNDNVTVADVGSRKRSQYKYKLKDIISQSKNASAGGPFWVIERPSKEDKNKNEKKTKTKTRTEVKMTYEVMKDATEEQVMQTVQEGVPVMMMTDSKVIEGEEFVYLTVIDSQYLVTVVDQNFTQQKQISWMELKSHLKSDITGLSYWKVTGNCDFLMPLSKKNNEKTTTEATTESTEKSTGQQ
jgi:hypothetical protein